MEITVVFQLLLLVCALFGAPVHTDTGNEITPQGKQTEGAEPASHRQQTCQPDIHTVLREMSALLAEQRVEMTYLQSDNKAQAAKLRDLEGQKTQMDEQLKAQAAKLREVDKQLKAQSADIATMKATSNITENQVEVLKRDREAQATELASVKARSSITENQVEFLKRDRKVKQVAFSASLLASGDRHVGPFNTHTNLVFRHITTNIGNAYNPNTGFFIAPVRGVYHFEFYVGASGHASYGSAVVLVKNGQHIFAAYEHQNWGYGTSSNGASLLLEVGDVVFLRLWQNSRIHDNQNHHSTFSGHLLFTM